MCLREKLHVDWFNPTVWGGCPQKIKNSLDGILQGGGRHLFLEEEGKGAGVYHVLEVAVGVEVGVEAEVGVLVLIARQGQKYLILNDLERNCPKLKEREENLKKGRRMLKGE